MKACQIVRYRISYWTKGYNKGKINALLTGDSGETILVENLTPEQGSFLLTMINQPGSFTCDPEHPELVLNLNVDRPIADRPT